MAPKKSKHKLVAKVVSEKLEPCAFCQRRVNDELTYGKLYAIGDIQCHYFCALLSSCLIQKGRDEDGLFGFLYDDIIKEVERAKKHRCSYCGRGGANLGCSISQCRKQFHLPCGRERNAVSMYYGNYKSFCQTHAPKQSIPPNIMAKAKQRMANNNKAKKNPDLKDLELTEGTNTSQTEESICVICYEEVEGYPTVNTFWPPCCARDKWFHRTCLQRMALSAGMHYLKCPLCNDKDNFYQAVVSQGYYVPDRDAAWELEQNAFQEIYEREVSCSAKECLCPMGRNHDADQGSWCIKLCLLCGTGGAHAACDVISGIFVCTTCSPAAPSGLEQLADSIQRVIIEEQAQTSSRVRRGPVMPARMSLRRTKPHCNMPSSSGHRGSACQITEIKTESTETSNTTASRKSLNLPPPKKQTRDSKTRISDQKSQKDNQGSPTKTLDFITDSPTKILEGLKSKNVDKKIVEHLRKKFKKPKPLSEKRKIINDILNGLFDNAIDSKQKEPALIKQWCSPKKSEANNENIEIETPTKNSQISPKQVQKSPKPDQKSPKAAQKSPTIEFTPTKVESKTSKTDFTPTKVELKSPKTNENYPKAIIKLSPSQKFAITPKTAEPTELTNYVVFNTPKKLKTIDVLNDSSLEISAKDEIINIDVIKIENKTNAEFLKAIEIHNPVKTKKSAFIFSPCNKESLDTEIIDLDIDSFKDRYLNEVGLTRKEPILSPDEPKCVKKSRKRKASEDNNIILKYDTKKRKRKQKNISIKDKNIKVKIKWQKEKLKLKITDSKKKSKKSKNKKYKQYVLEYSPQKSANIAKPTEDVTPIKRKYIKQEKTPDNLVQTSIQSFFKVKSPKE